ncbi:hypothetical protein B0H12DRAFT_159265 [Mycena haematopus]|nr:hypothetical protein B0H12DRAFT_159265 [Mycena haematopus]
MTETMCSLREQEMLIVDVSRVFPSFFLSLPLLTVRSEAEHLRLECGVCGVDESQWVSRTGGARTRMRRSEIPAIERRRGAEEGCDRSGILETGLVVLLRPSLNSRSAEILVFSLFLSRSLSTHPSLPSRFNPFRPPSLPPTHPPHHRTHARPLSPSQPAAKKIQTPTR